MKRSVIGLILLAGIALVAVPLAAMAWGGNDSTPTPTPTATIDPSLLVDSDGDGLVDVIDSCPNTPNDRYFILYSNEYLNQDWAVRIVQDEESFYLQQGIPSDHIINLAGEMAGKDSLREAIASCSADISENDILVVRISTHGLNGSFMGGSTENRKDVLYAELDGWLDDVAAKTIVVTFQRAMPKPLCQR